MKLFALLKPTRIIVASSLVLMCALPCFGANKETREQQEPSFSLDGTQLIYRDDIVPAGGYEATTTEIWIVNRDGTGAHALTSGAMDEHPRFSPDGKTVAFIRDHDIWLMSADGSNLRNLTNSKDIDESEVDFTNRGDLIFLRKTPVKHEKTTSNLDLFGMMAADVKTQSLVLRRLDDGSERDILQDGYQISQLVASPTDGNSIFIFCKPLDENGKPVEGFVLDKIIAVAKLDGSPPRTLYAPKPEDKISLSSMRIAGQLNFVYVSQDIHYYLALLQDGALVPLVLPRLPIFSDISRDGATIVGTTFRGLKLYDFESQTLLDLDGVPPAAKAQFDKAMAHIYSAEKATLITEFSRAIELYPNYADAYYYRGKARGSSGQTDDALKDLGEAIRLNPKMADARVARARILLTQDRNGEALDDLDKAILTDPNNPLIYVERGELHVKRMELAEALDDFDAAIKIRPDDWSFLLTRGDTLVKAGDNPAAIKDYTASIAAYPTFSLTYEKRAKAYRATGQNDLALADEKKVAELTKKAARH